MNKGHSLPLPGVYSVGLVFFGCALFYLAAQPLLTYPFTSICKSLPIFMLFIFALQAVIDQKAKIFLGLALCFSIFGDIALSLPLHDQFIWGLGFFFFAHLMYLCLFYSLKKSMNTEVSVSTVIILQVLILIAAAFVLYFILPKAGSLQWPVLAYMLVIGAMASMAVQCSFVLALGAFCFMFSDSLIGFSSFVYPDLNLHLQVMCTYYLAQFLLVSESVRLLSVKK